MKSRLFVFLGSLCISISAIAAQSIGAYVERIVDGDTVWLSATPPQPGKNNGTRYKIRMLGMDTPETHFPSQGLGLVGQQPWGDEATAALQSMIKVGDKVSFEDFGKDKYKRTLGFVFAGGRDLNLEMAKSGWAIPYALCIGCSTGFLVQHRVTQYQAACIRARQEGRGIFDPGRPLREMPFEFRARLSKQKPEKFVGDVSTKKLYKPADYHKVDVCNRVFFNDSADAIRLKFHW